MRGPGGHPILHIERIEGETADRVVLTGTFSRPVDNRDYERARVRQVWLRGPGGEMALVETIVAPWALAG